MRYSSFFNTFHEKLKTSWNWCHCVMSRHCGRQNRWFENDANCRGETQQRNTLVISQCWTITSMKRTCSHDQVGYILL
jgi:hypothetical protein